MRINRLSLILLTAAILWAACAPEVIPIPPTPTRIPPTPTLVALDLSAPMQVGSSYAYIDGSTLVAVPGGSFVMGHGSSDNPEHTVNVGNFWIYTTKVTNKQYALCVTLGQCTPPDETDNLGYTDFTHQNDPVVGVTYSQAAAYCSYVNGSLPTEAQWEKAARGAQGDIYPWGNDAPSCDLLNFNNCVRQTTDVTKYPRGQSPYGALDMEGNAFEWVADWYDAYYYRTGPDRDPTGPDTGRARVIRSSSYRSDAGQLPVYTRYFASPGDHRRDLGFRCVVTDPTYFAPFCENVSVVSSQDAAGLTWDCPTISIEVHAQNCQIGGALVTFNDDHADDPNAAFGGIVGCTLVSGTPGHFPLQYKCTTPSTATLSSSCTYSGITNATCAPHYTLNTATGICKWDGRYTTGLSCPLGNYYDPVKHCCSPLSGSVTTYPACPVGAVFAEAAEGHFVCLPGNSALSVPVQTKSVNPPVCPNTCTLNADVCGQRNLNFCSTNCTCLPVGEKCPTH